MRTRLLLARATLSLLALTMLVGVAAQAQEADKIIGQCLKAEGGRKALGKIQTLALEGTFPGAEGSPGTFTFYLKSPNRYYSELIVDNQPSIQAYNGKSAWRQNSAGDPSTMLGAANAELESASQYYNCLLYTSRCV